MLSTAELRQLGPQELQNELTKTIRELGKAKLALINGSSKESHTVKGLKAQIARINTLNKEAGNDVKAPVAKAEKKEAPVKTEKAETVAVEKPKKTRKSTKKA